MALLFISFGLFIGLIIGSRDVSVLYESVQKNNTEKSYLSLVLVAIAIFTGVMVNRNGSSVFIAELSRVSDLKAGAVISFSALFTVVMVRHKFKLVSISHAVIGAIIGWLLFVGHQFPLDQILYVVVIWLLSPILSFFIASWILSLSRRIIKKSKVHIFKMDLIFQWLTLLAMIIAAFSLGANNSANITGVYLLSLSGLKVSILNWNIAAEWVLFALAALSIIAGFFGSQFFGRKKDKKMVFTLSTEANFSVLMAYGIVFFMFSSRFFQQFLYFIGIPEYDLIPISTFHVLTAGLVGISYKKGYNIYDKETMLNLPVKSILTPLISGLLAFVVLIGIRLFFGDQMLFPESVDSMADGRIFSINDWDTIYNLMVIVSFVVLILLGLFIFRRMQMRLTKEKKRMEKQAVTLKAEKEFFVEELKYAHKTGTRLKKEVDLKTAELEKFALQLVEKESMLARLKNVIKLLKNASEESERETVIKEINLIINESLNLAKERELFYSSVSSVNSGFFIRLSQQFNNLTDNDKRLIALIKLGLSSKEIASLSNITSKSVEMNRYRLRKKLNLPAEIELSKFVNQI